MTLAQALETEIQSFRNQLLSIESKIDAIRQLVGPFAVPMPDGQMLVQTLHGIKYLIDPHDLIMAPQLIVYRQWEADLTAFFCSQFNSDTVFVDVGANFGYFACLAGTKISNAGLGSVIAIEPNPALFKLLKANSAINWSMCPIDLHACAIGASAGEVELWVPQDRAANASLSKAAGGDSVRVSLRTLDSLLTNIPSVSLLKIDVEGHEAAVLRGAEEVITRSRDIRIVIEWSLSQLKEANTTANDMLSVFHHLGIRAFELPPGKYEQSSLRPLSADYLRSTNYTNILLTH
jgi:FkbM family methyltransferase